MTIGSTLKLLRTASNLTQSSLAKDLNVTANYLSLVENGRKEPSLTFLKRFSKKLDAPLGYFLWLALEENTSQEEFDLKRKMDELLVTIIREKGKNSQITKNGDEETK
jgi:transcriptional regulator with XRE-family HTH domain